MKSAVLLSLSMLPLADAATRYNPSEGVYFGRNLHNATGDQVTPIASMPVQDDLYWWLSVTHAYIIIPIIIIITTQWVRTRGDSIHVNLGFIVKWLFVVMVIEGWVLNVRHSFLSKAEAFSEYPGVYDPPMSRPTISFFGFSITACVAQSFWIGIRDESRRVGLKTPAWWFIISLSVMTCVTGVWFYIFAIHRMLTEPVWTFKWEISLEAVIILSVLFVFDGTALWAMAGWAKTGELQDWKEHHHMMVAWLSSVVMAAFLLFLVHDARHFWTWPGLHNVFLRLLIQLAPQAVFYALTVPRIFMYLKVCGPNQEKRDVILHSPQEMTEKQ